MEEILAWIERIGGGYVWESEVFAVTLMEVPLTDEQAQRLCQLSGVEQIAVNAQALSLSALQSICSIPGLKSLVLGSCPLSPAEVCSLKESYASVDVQLA